MEKLLGMGWGKREKGRVLQSQWPTGKRKGEKMRKEEMENRNWSLVRLGWVGCKGGGWDVCV